MVATVSINPLLTTNAAGTFNVESAGYIQGMAMDAPNSRYNLAGGLLATTETLPMWGGVGISEVVPGGAGTPATVLGGIITRATTLTATSAGGLTGFSVFDQAYGMINSPQSPVPLAPSSGQVNYYRLGSGARIAVACDPSLVDLQGNIISQNVSWDFNVQRLQPYVASGATESISSITWSSTNGGQGAVVFGSASVFGLGDTIYISGATNTGTGGNTAVNGPFVITAFTDTTHMTIAMPAAASVIGTIAGTIVANVGTGALACKILDVNVGNSMIVSYNTVTGFATWNRSGTCALILI